MLCIFIFLSVKRHYITAFYGLAFILWISILLLHTEEKSWAQKWEANYIEFKWFEWAFCYAFSLWAREQLAFHKKFSIRHRLTDDYSRFSIDRNSNAYAAMGKRDADRKRARKARTAAGEKSTREANELGKKSRNCFACICPL